MRIDLATAALLFCSSVLLGDAASAYAETLRHPESLEQQLKAVGATYLAEQSRLRGDARRGALVFFKSAAACASCHSTGGGLSPLGPDLTTVGRDAKGKLVTDEFLIESLLHPSQVIRKGYETVSIVTSDGEVVRGLRVKESDDAWELRDATDLSKSIVINKDDIEAVKQSDKSMMPDGLVGSLANQGDFLDLVAYVTTIARGGRDTADRLKPSPEQLEIHDDSVNLDHARDHFQTAFEGFRGG